MALEVTIMILIILKKKDKNNNNKIESGKVKNWKTNLVKNLSTRIQKDVYFVTIN